MSERPKAGADPDATVMIPAAARSEPDGDATVMIPAIREPDADATVMIPASRTPAPEPDADATVMIPASRAKAPEPDADATVMIPARREPDPDATVMIPAARPVAAPAEPDADATVMIPAGTSPVRDIDPDATLAIPTPGRRRAEPPAPVPVSTAENARLPVSSTGGMNPLVAAANPILAVVAQIRHALRHPDPEGLRASLGQAIEAFEASAVAQGTAPETIAFASRALCALIDESAGSTPWGAGWRTRGFLAERHGDGALDTFEALETLAERPAENLDLLEFIYACVCLGLEGRYAGQAGSREKLDEIRARLRDLLSTQYPRNDGELSERWRGLDLPARKPPGGLGLWSAFAGAVLVLALAYLGFSVLLGEASDPVAREIAQLKLPPAPVAAAAPTPGLTKLLQEQIGGDEVAVTESDGRAVVSIRSDRLFASGSARLEPAIEPVLGKIAAVLDRVPGAIVVAGHTDDVPIRTARFPSNWELSAARADSVVRLLRGQLKDASRVTGEGVADSEPLAPNDSAANRARNRRVTLILRGGA